ncbi:MAG: hypothetical protein L6R42_004883 [Xanthoria sp. 1 TBL-2021]|nr:MAG: hypothetical protein L6R42_004883 [Xanthoria sp. 1 TBL-2021]
MAEVEIPTYLRRCVLPQSVLEKACGVLSEKILLPRWEAWSGLMKQLEQLYAELNEHEKKWREFERMTDQHNERIRKILFSSKQHRDIGAEYWNKTRRLQSKVGGVVDSIEMSKDDTVVLLRELHERFMEL